MEVVLVAVAFLSGLIMHGLGLPPMVGYLAAGFALQAAGFAGGEVLGGIAHFGVLLLLFSVGLKLQLRTVVRPEIWVTTLVHLTATAVPMAVLLWLVGVGASQPLVLLALCLGFSSTVLAAKVLEDKHELKSFHGRIAIGILIVQDLVAIAMLSVGGGAPPVYALGLLALPLLRPLLWRLLDGTGHTELLLLFGLLLAIAGGELFEHSGLSSELGALVFGALLAGHRKTTELADTLWALKEAFLVGFFLQIGLSGLPSAGELAIALLLVAALPLKAMALAAILLLFRLRARSAFLTAVALASYSEFALIVGATVSEAGWLEERWITVLAVAIALSLALAAPLNRAAHRLFERWEPRLVPLERGTRHPDERPPSIGKAHLLVLGMGRAGTAAYEFLTQHDERVVGLDSDMSNVERHLKRGRRVVYADAEDPSLWTKLRLDGVRAVLLMMPDREARETAARKLREAGYKGLIGGTCHYRDESEALLGAGADMTFNYYAEAGVGLAEHVLEALEDGVKTRQAAGA